jgi:peptidoglycan/LPS O-acetylase OafA/YrhL
MILPGVFSNNIYPNAVNGSLWSLSAEVGMYIALPPFCCSLGEGGRGTAFDSIFASVGAYESLFRAGLPVGRSPSTLPIYSILSP